MTCDATWVINPWAMFEPHMTYRARDTVSKIFHFYVCVGKWVNLKCHLSTVWRERRIIRYCVWDCDLHGRPVGVTKKGKKNKETFMRQTGYLPRPPTSM